MKLTQKTFNEEMFYVVYQLYLSDSGTMDGIVELAVDGLRTEGYDIDEHGQEDGFNRTYYYEIPKLNKRVQLFVKRFQKLTGYIFDWYY